MLMGGSERSVQIRIAGGGWRGVLELNIDGGGWQAVCNDGFDDNVAETFCKQLGYLSGKEYDPCGYDCDDNGFAADDIECPYDASSISVRQQLFVRNRSDFGANFKVLC